MKASEILILVTILLITSGYSATPDISAEQIEKSFRKLLPKEATYTKVPRGLIISIDENILFNECSPYIKESSLKILDNIATILKSLTNYCVIENHIEQSCKNEIENWELSMIRSANIADYLLKYNQIPHEQLFDIGYGEYMPFNENLNNETIELGNRVDFVILNYEAKR